MIKAGSDVEAASSDFGELMLLSWFGGGGEGCVCVCVCVRAFVHACMCACIRAHMHAYMRAYVHVLI